YPAPQPLLLEQDSSVLGGPFMLMEAFPGETMLALVVRRFVPIFWGSALMARAQAQLHSLPYNGFPAPEKPFLPRRLAELRQIVYEYNLSRLLPGLSWLNRYRPQPEESPCIVHLDFHPANVIFHRWKCRGIVDWCESDV